MYDRDIFRLNFIFNLKKKIKKLKNREWLIFVNIELYSFGKGNYF